MSSKKGKSGDGLRVAGGVKKGKGGEKNQNAGVSGM
jgi:hypothetical protein